MQAETREVKVNMDDAYERNSVEDDDFSFGDFDHEMKQQPVTAYDRKSAGEEQRCIHFFQQPMTKTLRIRMMCSNRL